MTRVAGMRVAAAIATAIGLLGLLRIWTDFPIYPQDAWTTARVVNVTEKSTQEFADTSTTTVAFNCAEWTLEIRIDEIKTPAAGKLQVNSCAAARMRGQIAKARREGLLIAFDPSTQRAAVPIGLFNVSSYGIYIFIASVGLLAGGVFFVRSRLDAGRV